MKKLSTRRLADVVRQGRAQGRLTQEQLASLTGINRTMIGRIEKENYIPSVQQLE